MSTPSDDEMIASINAAIGRKLDQLADTPLKLTREGIEVALSRATGCQVRFGEPE